MDSNRFARWRKAAVLEIGGMALDLIAVLGAVLPFILVTAILYSVVLPEIIENEWARLIAAMLSALVIELYAIGLMVLEYRVDAYNRQYGEEIPIEDFHPDRMKAIYLVNVLCIVIFGHIIPVILPIFLPNYKDGLENVAIVSVIFMALIAWGSYKLFATNFALKELYDLAEQSQKDESETMRLELQSKKLDVELEKQRASKERAKARRAAAAKKKVQQVQPLKSTPTPAPMIELPVSIDDWMNLSFEAQDQALKAGAKPPEIKHLATWERYNDLAGRVNGDVLSTKELAEIMRVNNTRVRKDMKLLYPNGLVEVVSSGQYRLKS